MPFIGFEEDRKPADLTEEEIDKRLEEIKKQPVEEREEITLSTRTLERIRGAHTEVVVNDFGDGYHKSTDDLEHENQLYLSYRKIDGKKRKFNKLPEFIEATRNCLDFMYEVSERQSIYEPEEFRRLWAKGKIIINGMYLPKYTGKDRKRLSAKGVAEYILMEGSPYDYLDDKDLAPEITTPEDLDRMVHRYFTEEELEYVFQDPDNVRDIQDDMIDEDVEKSYVGKPYAVDLNDKEQAKLMKHNPGLPIVIKDVLMGGRAAATYGSNLIYSMEETDIEAMEQYDRKYGYASNSDIPQFSGSFMSKKDYREYMEAMEDWEFHNIRVRYNGKTMTWEEANDRAVKEMLEANGYDVRKFWGNPERDVKLADYLKKERKKESRLKKQLSKIQKHRDKRDEDATAGYRQMSDASKKKQKKKKKKGGP